MLNHITIMGRLTRDPEIRQTQGGTPVTSFSLAVERDFKEKGSDERATDFIDVTAWRSAAEFVGKYFAKGRMVVVDGRLQMREWTDKEGNKRRSFEVVAEHVYFGDTKQEPGESKSASSTKKETKKKAPTAPTADADDEEEDGDLPF